MPINSGEGKILRILRQLENVEILLGGLPKRFIQPDERKEQVKALLGDIARIQNQIKDIYKTELEDFQKRNL